MSEGNDMLGKTLAMMAFWSWCSIAVAANDFLPTEQECREASDFIKHAAMSRDNGYSQKKLVQRFDDDVLILSGMDPQKRWFIRSPGATRFLRAALVEAFEAPRQPKDQAARFFKSCMDHVLSADDL